MNGGIVVHITSGEVSDWQMALRNLVNLVGDESVSTPPERMQVVVNGPAVRFLLASSPEASKIAQMVKADVDINVCSNSLARFGYEIEDMTEGVTPVPSGVAEVLRAQKAGKNYLKLP
ncbi:DsrE family protein [Halorientalis salina]|uniref:DsrE family protein n=1 Tax=Halorientalis salina TaxID=2932266 RepID=UPI0010AD7A75|nr:DsrE family protein [Halorientalis salina]